MSVNILIIGYGNTLRGDDGAGCRVVEKLGIIKGVKSRCELRIFHQLLPEHSELISAYKRLVLVDASCDVRPGEVYLEHLCRWDERDCGESSFNAHRFSPQSVLNAAENLYGNSPDTYLCKIGGGEFGFSVHLSMKTGRAVEEAVAKIRHLISHWCVS